MAMPMGSAAKVVTLGGFKRCVTSFRVAAWINMFHNASEIVLCDRCGTFASFSEDDFIFCCRRSALETSIVIFPGRRSTSDASCRVFLRIALSGLRQVVTTCVAFWDI